MKRKKNTPLSSEEKLKKGRMIDKKIVLDATLQSLVKLNPKTQIKNPVMFVVYLGAILTTVLFFLSLGGIKDGGSWYIFAISLILWFTSLFGNFAEAIAEGRGRAQAESLKRARRDVVARKLASPDYEAEYIEIKSSELKPKDIVLVKAGEQIPMDGEVIAGIASVDESAITGESAPVIRRIGRGQECGDGRNHRHQRLADRPRNGRGGKELPR